LYFPWQWFLCIASACKSNPRTPPPIVCNCTTEGSNGIYCNGNGVCDCKPNFVNDKCDECAVGYFKFPTCEACNCSPQGSNSSVCDDNGVCNCKANFVNDKCGACADGYFNFPTCEACNCNTEGSNDITCDDNSVCNCKANITNGKCDACVAGFFNFPTCEACNCNVDGSNGNICDDNGACSCRANVTNNKCDACNAGYFNFPTCEVTPELADIKLTTKNGISCGGYYVFAQICSSEQSSTCCEEEIVKNEDTGFKGGDLIQTKLQSCTDFIATHFEENLTIKLEGWNELTKNSRESLCPGNLKIHLGNMANFTASFENKRVEQTPRVNLLLDE